jgi:hypothetical protein
MWLDSRWDLFGTYSAPGNLKKTLESSPERPTWTLLHLRRSCCIMERAVVREKVQSAEEDMIEEDMIESSELASGKSRAVPMDHVERRFGLLDFVRWTFGPQGLPDLQIIAYGDFSAQGRYARFNSLFRGDRDGLFCELTKKAASGWPLIEKHRGARALCNTLDPQMNPEGVIDTVTQ